MILENDRIDTKTIVKLVATTTPAGLPDEIEIRHLTHRVVLTNQDIIDLAYTHRDLTDRLGNGGGVSFEEANCYAHVRFLISKLLEVVDPAYLKQHADVVGFFSDATEGAAK